MTTNPTENSKDNPEYNAVPLGTKINQDTAQEANETKNTQREPLPIEFREFTASIRELFRECKKFVIFIRHRHNGNAALIFLTFLLAIAAFTQAIIYGLQLHPIRENAEAAKTAADTARKELELSERPWVSIENVSVIAPLVFDSNGAHTTIKYSIVNTGRSPAIDGVDDLLDLFVPYMETPDPVSKREHVCQGASMASGRIQNRGMSKFSKTWFPGQSQPQTLQVSWSLSDIREAMTVVPKKIFPNSALPLPNFFTPTLVTCIAYRASFTDSQYHTGYIFILANKKTGKYPTFMKSGEVPAENLEMIYHPFYGISAE